MVKSVLSVYHQGLSDWIIQRLSALFMAIYSIGFLVYLMGHTELSFAEWHHLFSFGWMKVASVLFLLCMLWHAWIGMWTIFTDYVKPFLIRCILTILVLFMLIASFFWGVLILWSV